MLLGVVDPVSSAPGSNDALELIGLDPEELLDKPVPPDVEQLAAELHCPTGDPE